MTTSTTATGPATRVTLAAVVAAGSGAVLSLQGRLAFGCQLHFFIRAVIQQPDFPVKCIANCGDNMILRLYTLIGKQQNQQQ